MISHEPSLPSPNCVAATATTAARLVHCTLESRQADIARLLLAVKRAKKGTSRRMKEIYKEARPAPRPAPVVAVHLVILGADRYGVGRARQRLREVEPVSGDVGPVATIRAVLDAH